MSSQAFDVGALAATPWKNGGGTTREIVCWPPGAGLDAFEWRVSIASIAASGPFSVFPGIDRSITLLEGAGVRLHAVAQGIDHRLDTPFTPFSFSGDAALHCDLLGGPSSDFNVMSRRGRLRAGVSVLHDTGELAPARHGLLWAVRGAWTVQPAGAAPQDLPAGHGLWWADDLRMTRMRPAQPGAILLAVRLDADL